MQKVGNMDVLRNVKTYRSPKTITIDYKCMNCNGPLDETTHGLYGRRFCSEKCKDKYLENPK